MVAHATTDAESELAALLPELEALADGNLLPVHADPRTAAITGLLVADFLAQPSLAQAISALTKVGVARGDCVERTKSLARCLLLILTKLGGSYLAGVRAPERMVQKAENLRATMTKRLE